MSDRPEVGKPLNSRSVDLLVRGDVLIDSDGVICRFEHRASTSFGIQTSRNPHGPFYLAESFTFIGRPDQDGWMPHDGGLAPLPHETPGLEVRCRNGRVHRASGFQSHYWLHDGDGYDIMAFRLAKPEPGDRSDIVHPALVPVIGVAFGFAAGFVTALADGVSAIIRFALSGSVPPPHERVWAVAFSVAFLLVTFGGWFAYARDCWERHRSEATHD